MMLLIFVVAIVIGEIILGINCYDKKAQRRYPAVIRLIIVSVGAIISMLILMIGYGELVADLFTNSAALSWQDEAFYGPFFAAILCMVVNGCLFYVVIDQAERYSIRRVDRKRK